MTSQKEVRDALMMFCGGHLQGFLILPVLTPLCLQPLPVPQPQGCGRTLPFLDLPEMFVSSHKAAEEHYEKQPEESGAAQGESKKAMPLSMDSKNGAVNERHTYNRDRHLCQSHSSTAATDRDGENTSCAET